MDTIVDIDVYCFAYIIGFDPELDKIANEVQELQAQLRNAMSEITFPVNKSTEELKAQLQQEIKEKNNTLHEKFIEISKQNAEIIKQQEEIIKQKNEVIKQKNEELQLKPFFHTIQQGEMTNRLSKIKVKPQEVDLFGDMTLNDKDFKLVIKNYNELTRGLEQSTLQLLDTLGIVATQNGQDKETLVILPLKEYMEMRGLKDIKSAREQVVQDLDTLFNARISFKDKTKSKRHGGDFADIRIIQRQEISKGIIYCRFGEDFYKVYRSYTIMPYHKEGLKFNGNNNPNSYYFHRRISEHKNMNIGKSNENIIGVETLLKASPNIPTLQDLNIPQVSKRIINPFIRDMDELTERGILKWHFIGDKGLQIEEPDTYNEFITANIKIEWINYPDQTKRLEAKKKRIQSAKRKATRKIKPPIKE
jgi:ElaB/YqjD/DUF883 family membrane-anchored ribosome-binding protein